MKLRQILVWSSFVHLVTVQQHCINLVVMPGSNNIMQQIQTLRWKSYHNRPSQNAFSSAPALVPYINLRRPDYKVLVMVNLVVPKQNGYRYGDLIIGGLVLFFISNFHCWNEMHKIEPVLMYLTHDAMHRITFKFMTELISTSGSLKWNAMFYDKPQFVSYLRFWQ